VHARATALRCVRLSSGGRTRPRLIGRPLLANEGPFDARKYESVFVRCTLLHSPLRLRRDRRGAGPRSWRKRSRRRKVLLSARTATGRRCGAKPGSSESLERRRRWCAIGKLPPQLACRFTMAETAALGAIAVEVVKNGDCREDGSRRLLEFPAIGRGNTLVLSCCGTLILQRCCTRVF
jgi:hypothetical protein